MKIRWAAALIVVCVALSACAAPVHLGNAPVSPAASQPADPGAVGGASDNIDYGTANVEQSVMAQTTVGIGALNDATRYMSSLNGEALQGGGTITVILRSVLVQGSTLTIRFALQWDNSSQPDDALASFDDLGVDLSNMMAVDNQSLTAYRPFCTNGVYPEGSLDSDSCLYTQLVWPAAWSDRVIAFFQFPNHGLIEGGAILPAPTGNPATLDIALGSPLPVFTDATVTYR